MVSSNSICDLSERVSERVTRVKEDDVGMRLLSA